MNDVMTTSSFLEGSASPASLRGVATNQNYRDFELYLSFMDMPVPFINININNAGHPSQGISDYLRDYLSLMALHILSFRPRSTPSVPVTYHHFNTPFAAELLTFSFLPV